MKASIILLWSLLLVSHGYCYIPNCNKYTSKFPETCEECNVGYYVGNGGYACMTCSSSCLTCIGPSSNQCTSCKTGFYRTLDNTCYPCMTGCSSCKDGYTCVTCSTGYYKTNDNRCYNCLGGCISCNDGFTCNTCKDGYYKTFDKRCYSCISNCESCSNGYQCNTCRSGYKKIAISSSQDECSGSEFPILLTILIIFIIVFIIICTICSIWWAAISQCLGVSRGPVIVDNGYGVVIDNDYDTYVAPPAFVVTSPSFVVSDPIYINPPPPAYETRFPEPPPPAYEPAFPNPPPPAFEPAFPDPPPAHPSNYDNSGMPW